VVALPVVPLRERMVEIEAALGTGSAAWYRYGSGFRVGGRLVLTAAHVVAGAAAAGITVRGPDKVPHPARVVDGLAGDPDTVDLALLKLCDQATELPAPPVAVVDRDVPVPVEGCWAVGYPLFQEVESAAGVVRETAQVWGMILPAENLVGGLLSLHVTSAPRALPPQQEALGQSQWSGMSGAAVLAGERLIGVVSEHAPRRGDSTITVTPLASLDRLPAAAAAQWWAHLAADRGRLVMLPARQERAEPAYRATLRQLRARTGVLQGRDGELEAIGAFATGQPNPLAPPGSQHAWLADGPWAGKTALLAEAVHALPAVGLFASSASLAGSTTTARSRRPGALMVAAGASAGLPTRSAGQASVTVGLGVPVTTLNFVLTAIEPFTVKGTVSSQTGAALEGAAVTLDIGAHTITGTGGSYKFTDQAGSPNPGAEYTLTASMAGFMSSTVTFTIPNGATVTENLVLEQLGSLSGTVISAAGGAPISGAIVTADTVSGTSGPAGAYSLPSLDPDATNVFATAPGFDPAQAQVSIPPGAHVVHDITMTPASATLTGTVTSQDDGLPVPATIAISGTGGTQTDSTGSYTLSHVSAGDHTVTVSADRFKSQTASIQVTAHQTLRQDFVLFLLHQPKPIGDLPKN
jgi:hypothetical protein